MNVADFASDWIAAWNSHDLDRVLRFYTDDLEMSSPHIKDIAGEATGTLHGKASVRAYWEKAMKLRPGLRFSLELVYGGVNSVVICYTNQVGRRCGEVLFFDSEWKCFRSAAHHAQE